MVRLLASNAGRKMYENLGFTSTDEMALKLWTYKDRDAHRWAPPTTGGTGVHVSSDSADKAEGFFEDLGKI